MRNGPSEKTQILFTSGIFLVAVLGGIVGFLFAGPDAPGVLIFLHVAGGVLFGLGVGVIVNLFLFGEKRQG